MELKNVGYQPKLVYLKDKKPVTIGPRARIEVSENDLKSSSQLRELLARGDLRKVPPLSASKIKGEEGKDVKKQESGKGKKPAPKA